MYPSASKNPQNFHHIDLVSLTQGPFSQQAFREEEMGENKNRRIVNVKQMK
jgi:hypothetical protein